MKNTHAKTPYLSIVAATRNDNHGGNMKLRMQVFINALAAQCQRHKLPVELVLVEWNPPKDAPPLAEALEWPKGNDWLSIKIVHVPYDIHKRYKDAPQLPLYQMIAKNVGIRHAKGEFVLCTNVDIVFSEELFAFLASRDLRPGTVYRSERHDVDNKLNPDWELDDILQYCKDTTMRVNTRDYSQNLETGSKHVVYPEDLTEEAFGKAKLFTNACGDFTLLSRQDWLDLRGYVEWDMYSLHMDSLFLYEAHYSGCKEVILPPSQPHYHIEHMGGWSPESHQAGTLKNRLQQDNVGMLSNEDYKGFLASLVHDPGCLKKDVVVWGLSGDRLQKTTIVKAAWERP